MNSPKFLLLAVLVMTIIGTVLSFQPQQQQQHCSSSSRSTRAAPLSPESIIVALHLSDDNNDNKPQLGDDVGIPKLKLPPLPSLSMPEIDGKETLKKVGVLAATIIAFVIIQKVGLLVSEVYTPELSAEQVRDF
ncbi:hypothetical protein FRACYDRAFT_220081, partial [Fragilariopsis cylindrus CCMP1102]